MKILLFGAKGYMGSHVRDAFDNVASSDADIADPVAVATALDGEKPDVVINAAGKTGRPNVDWCEDHKEETLRSNVAGPLVLLEECGKRGLYWAHFGSGCIYEGDNDGKGFAEHDPPNFYGSFYSRTKAWSDVILQEFPVLQLRLRMPFDGTDEPRNLVSKLRKYPRVLDAPNSLTYIPDFLIALRTLIERRVTGTFNVVNPGAISPYDVMRAYRSAVDPSHACERLTLEELPDVVRTGRSTCVLDGSKLREEGVTMRPVEDALREALEKMRGKNP